MIIIIQTPPGETYQWTFVIPMTQDKPAGQDGVSTYACMHGGVTTQSASSSNDDPFKGPDCCVTLPPQYPGGVGWPIRVNKTVPTVYTELLLNGTNISADMNRELEKNVVNAVRTYLCPKGQQVW